MQKKRVLAKNMEQHLINCVDLKLFLFYVSKYRVGLILLSLPCSLFDIKGTDSVR